MKTAASPIKQEQTRQERIYFLYKGERDTHTKRVKLCAPPSISSVSTEIIKGLTWAAFPAWFTEPKKAEGPWLVLRRVYPGLCAQTSQIPTLGRVVSDGQMTRKTNHIYIYIWCKVSREYSTSCSDEGKGERTIQKWCEPYFLTAPCTHTHSALCFLKVKVSGRLRQEDYRLPQKCKENLYPNKNV